MGKLIILDFWVHFYVDWVGLISSEEALHTIMIELHLQVSSFNHLIVSRASSSRSHVDV